MLASIIKIGGIGCLIFTFLILILSKSGIAATIRDDEGHFKKQINWKSLTGMIVFVFFLFGTLFLGNIRLAHQVIENPSLLQFFLNSFGIFFVMHLYDLIVLDYLIIVKWHPDFLKLPDTAYYNSIQPHVKGFIRGIPFGLMVSVLVTIASAFII